MAVGPGRAVLACVVLALLAFAGPADAKKKKKKKGPGGGKTSVTYGGAAEKNGFNNGETDEEFRQRLLGSKAPQLQRIVTGVDPRLQAEEMKAVKRIEETHRRTQEILSVKNRQQRSDLEKRAARQQQEEDVSVASNCLSADVLSHPTGRPDRDAAVVTQRRSRRRPPTFAN